MPSNTTYNPPNVDAFVKTALNYDAIGITGTASAGSTTNIDHALTDDMLLTGAQVLTNTANFGDSLTFQVGCYWRVGSCRNGVESIRYQLATQSRFSTTNRFEYKLSC